MPLRLGPVTRRRWILHSHRVSPPVILIRSHRLDNARGRDLVVDDKVKVNEYRTQIKVTFILNNSLTRTAAARSAARIG